MNRHRRTKTEGFKRRVAFLLFAIFALSGTVPALAADLTLGSGVVITMNNTTATFTDLTISSGGTLDAGSGTINLTGNWANSGTFTYGTSTVNFKDPGNSVVSGASTFYNLNMTTTAGKQVTFTAGTTQTVTNSITLQGAALNLLEIISSAPPTQASIDLQAGGTQTIDYVDVEYNNAVGETLGQNTAATYNSTDNGNNTYWFVVPYTISSGNTVAIGTGTVTYGDLIIDSGGRLTVSTGTVHVTHNWTNNGTFTGTSGRVNVNKKWRNNGTFTHTSGTVAVTGETTNAGTINNGSGTVDLTGDLTNSGTLNTDTGTVNVGGDATVSSGGTINVGSGTVDVVGDTTISSGGTIDGGSGTVEAGGSWTNSGTFTAGTGSVNFVDGTSPVTIAGNTTFYDLNMTTSSGKEIDLTAGSTQTVSNALSMQGASGNLLKIRSSTPGTQASIDFQAGGTQTISYVDVMDNNAVGETLVPNTAEPYNSTDSGNNTNWFFALPTLATTTPTSYDCSVTKVEMHNGTSWVTIFSGTAALDVVVSGGTFPGINDLSLPAGTYSQIRVTFTNSFPLKSSRSYGAATYYTTAATFGGAANLASTATKVAESMAKFTFRVEAWGAINTQVPQTFAITPITVGPSTDYQPTVRITISDKLLLKGTDGTPSTYYFALSAPTVSIVEP